MRIIAEVRCPTESKRQAYNLNPFTPRPFASSGDLRDGNVNLAAIIWLFDSQDVKLDPESIRVKVTAAGLIDRRLEQPDPEGCT